MIPSQSICLGCGPGPQQRARERQPHIDVSLPLSSLPSPLSKNNKIFKKYFLKRLKNCYNIRLYHLGQQPPTFLVPGTSFSMDVWLGDRSGAQARFPCGPVPNWYQPAARGLGTSDLGCFQCYPNYSDSSLLLAKLAKNTIFPNGFPSSSPENSQG